MSHSPVLYCVSLPDVAGMFAVRGNFQPGDFGFCASTGGYYSYTAIFTPGDLPNVEGGWWTPFTGVPPVVSTAYVEQDYAADPAIVIGDVGKAVRMRADGLVDFADATGIATAPAFGFISAVPAPGVATVRYVGQVTVGGLVVGSVYYLDVAGGVTASPPDVPNWVIQRLGVAVTGAILMVNVTENLTVLSP